MAEPNRLNLALAANRHLTFGEGGDYGVGAALARLEGRIPFPALVERFSHLRLAHLRNAHFGEGWDWSCAGSSGFPSSAVVECLRTGVPGASFLPSASKDRSTISRLFVIREIYHLELEPRAAG